MSRAEHWEQVYQTKGTDQVSWFQAEARLSRQLIETQAPDRSCAIIDIGAGASTLVDGLLDANYHALTVLDLSPAALQVARARLGARASGVEWRAADVLEAALPTHAFDVWHDRAVFHFLTADADRRRYVAQVQRAVRPGGLVIVATFAEDGPLRCSGLEVARYSPTQLHAEFGAQFALLESHRELHTTPSGATQAFTYCVCRVETIARTDVAASRRLLPTATL
jgi:SAM-dependent methyltransferase